MDIFEKYLEMRKNLTPTRTFGELPVESLSFVLDVVEKTKPKNILEIGFRRGCSALMWLLIDKNVKIHSIDIFVSPDNHDCDEKLLKKIIGCRRREEMLDVTLSIDFLQKTFPNRFTFETMNSSKINEKNWKDKFDFIFIDGGHDIQDVTTDTQNSINLNPQYIFFDDYIECSHIQKIVAEHSSLEIIKIYELIKGKSGGHCLTKVKK